MNQVAVIANALIDHAPILALPRWRVMADVRAVYGCGEWTARNAYALARNAGHRRRRETCPHAKVERRAACAADCEGEA